MMREVCTEDAIAQTFEGLPGIAGEQFREQMGVTVFAGDREVSLPFQFFIDRSVCYNSHNRIGVDQQAAQIEGTVRRCSGESVRVVRVVCGRHLTADPGYLEGL